MYKYLTYISEEEYLEKLNDGVIDATIDEYHIFIFSKFFGKQRRKTTVPLQYFNDILRLNRIIMPNSTIYDHIDNFRLPILNGDLPKSVRCPFSSPYLDIEDIKDYIREAELNPDHKIYLVNPKHYRYKVEGTITLAHVEDLDSKYYEGKTDYCVSCINKYMIAETGEPLFYLI